MMKFVIVLFGTGSLVLFMLALLLPAETSTTTVAASPALDPVEEATFYPPNDPGFLYTGRWQVKTSSGKELDDDDDERRKNVGVALADWPCSRAQFQVSLATPNVSDDANNDGTTASTTTTTTATPLRLTLHLKLNRVRVHVVVTNTAGQVMSATILDGGNAMLWGGDGVRTFDLVLDHSHTKNSNDPNVYTVTMTKLTQGSPYMNGVGKSLKSVLEFHGLDLVVVATAVGATDDKDHRRPAVRLLPQLEDDLSLPLSSSSQQQRRRRRVALIGASDTAGYCVDGTPATTDAKWQPWKYDNCDMASHAVLGRRLGADTSVQAMAGIGLTQNAFASMPYLLGRDTMPDYYNRALQTQEEPLWNFQQWRPDVVLVSLGGNDFNHQREVPSNETFQTAYHQFLQQIAEPYLQQQEQALHSHNDTTTALTIVSICGQGDPTESERDPNNDRCRPCPHVQQATESFHHQQSSNNSKGNRDYSRVRVEYIFIPCNGSVVTGIDDIGCEGHKNRLGQKRVADFIEPRLRAIMGWHDDTVNNDNNDDNDHSSSHVDDFPTQDAFYQLLTHQQADVVQVRSSSTSSDDKQKRLVVAGLILLTAAVIMIVFRRRMVHLDSLVGVFMLPTKTHGDDDEDSTTCPKKRAYKRCSTTGIESDDDDSV